MCILWDCINRFRFVLINEIKIYFNFLFVSKKTAAGCFPGAGANIILECSRGKCEFPGKIEPKENGLNCRRRRDKNRRPLRAGALMRTGIMSLQTFCMDEILERLEFPPGKFAENLPFPG